VGKLPFTEVGAELSVCAIAKQAVEQPKTIPTNSLRKFDRKEIVFNRYLVQ
jgi:hypothetical protein